MQARTFWTWLREIDRGIFRNRNHRKDLRYQILRPFWAKGPKTVDRRRKATKPSLLLSLSLCLYPIPCSIFLPTETVPASQPTPREAPRVQGCRAFSRISYRDRGSIYTIPVFLSYLPTHRRLLLLVVEHSRSPLMREHTRERQRQR